MMRRCRVFALLCAVSACAGHPLGASPTPRPPPGPGAPGAHDAVVLAFDELVDRVVPTEHQPGALARRSLAAARGHASAIELPLVDRLDALLANRDSLPWPSGLPAHRAYDAVMDRLQDEMTELFPRVADVYPEDSHLAARVALFFFLLQYGRNPRLTCARGIIHGMQIGVDRSPPSASPSDVRWRALGVSRMDDAARRFPDDPEVRWLAGNVCTASRRDVGGSVAPCLDHFLKCHATERCAVAYEAARREVAHPHCDGGRATGLAVYPAVVAPPGAKADAPSIVELGGRSYALKEPPIFTDADVEELYEESFQTNFSVAITDPGTPELETVVRVRLRPERRGAVAATFNALLQAAIDARGPDGAYIEPPVVVMRGRHAEGIMTAASPWNGLTDFTLWDVRTGGLCGESDDVTSLRQLSGGARLSP